MKTFLSVAVCLAMICFAGRSFAQTQLVGDDFTGGSNGSYLGPNWTGCGYNNGAYNVLVYQNGSAGGSGFWAQDCAVYTGYGVFPSDQYVSATIVAQNPNSSPQASIQLRANATPNTDEYYVACGWDSQDFPADPHYRIWSLGPGASGPVSLWLSNIIPTTNDAISCQMLGNTLTMQVNGSVIAKLVDTSGNNSGYPGLYYVDPNGTGPTPSDIIFANFTAGSGPALLSVNITPPSASVTTGSYIQFTGVATYADGSTAGMNNWLSSDPTVAIVDNTGFVYGAAAGNVTITGASAGDSGTANLTVAPPSGYTPLVHDSFTGTGGGYLGSNWTGCGFDGGAYGKLVYQNNQAGGSGYYSQNCAVYTGYGTFPSDQYATALIVSPNPASTTEASIQVRGNATPSSSESYIACGWDAQDFAPDYHYRIWSLAPNAASGGPTSLYLSNLTPATNDVVWCQIQGTKITMKVNGATIASVTDTSGLMTGYPGLYYIDLNGDVPPPTDVIFDNFVAGQITSVAPTISFTGAPTTAAYSNTFTVHATTNASTMPTITATAGICSVGTVTGTPASASATVTMTSSTGTCTLSARWAADSNYSVATAPSQNTTATKAASSTRITSNSPNPSAPQQAVTIGFSVSGAGAGPTGSVTVTASTNESCTATLNSAHTGSCSITFSTTGSRTLTAFYGGDGNFTSSTSSGVSQLVSSPTITLSTSNLNFGNISRGNSQTKGVTVSNTGAGTVSNLSWSITGTNATQFSVSSSTCGTTLSAGRNCVINVTFRPTITGNLSATLRLTDSAANSPQSVTLTGSGK